MKYYDKDKNEITKDQADVLTGSGKRHGMSGGNVYFFTDVEETERLAKITTWEAGVDDRDWADVREIRDGLLTKTDWTQMVDYNGADKEAWATYRQALRDLPQTYTGDELIQSIANRTDLVNPVDDGKWPTKPGT